MNHPRAFLFAFLELNATPRRTRHRCCLVGTVPSIAVVLVFNAVRRPRRRNSRQTQNTAQAINHDHGARPSFLLVELLHFIMAESGD